MCRKTIFGVLGAVLLAGPVVASPIANPPAVAPGGTTVALAGFGVAGAGGYFDLWLTVPSEFLLVRISDDPGDNDTAGGYSGPYGLYQKYTGGIGSSLDLSFAYDGVLFNASGDLGLRVTGSHDGYSKVKLELQALSSIPVGDYTISYNYRTSNDSCQDDSSPSAGTCPSGTLNVTVTGGGTPQIPSAGIDLLLFSGLGGLVAARRIHRQG